MIEIILNYYLIILLNVTFPLLVVLLEKLHGTTFFDQTQLIRESSIKDLGVWLYDTLTFNGQINHVVDKANKVLGLITRLLSELRDPLYLKALYCCWVRSMLDYAGVVWAPAVGATMQTLERMQRKFTRIAILRFLHGVVHLP